MHPLGALQGILQGGAKAIDNGLSSVGQAIGGAVTNSMQALAYHPTTDPQTLNPNTPHTPVTQQLPPWMHSPVPTAQVVPHVPNPGLLQQAQQMAQNVFQPQPTHIVLGTQQAPTPTPVDRVPVRSTPVAPPNITIPYSQGGQYTLPPQLSQTILNSFNDLGQATNAAQVLNHPKQVTGLPGEFVQTPNYGENAGFRTSNVDATNTDGSVDRGFFRINSNTFNGIMHDPFWGNVARQKFGIQNWNDMEDAQKNANMARLILQRSNWNSQTQTISTNPNWRAWFAAPQQLRAGTAPTPSPLQQLHTNIQQRFGGGE